MFMEYDVGICMLLKEGLYKGNSAASESMKIFALNCFIEVQEKMEDKDSLVPSFSQTFIFPYLLKFH